MAEKTIPVWLHQGEGQKVQIGVAAEVDPETNAQAIEIWPEFKEHNIVDYTIGDSEPAAPENAEEPKLLTREEFKAKQEKENKS